MLRRSYGTSFAIFKLLKDFYRVWHRKMAAESIDEPRHNLPTFFFQFDLQIPFKMNFNLGAWYFNYLIVFKVFVCSGVFIVECS